MSILTLLLATLFLGGPQSEGKTLIHDTDQVQVTGAIEECSSPHRSVVKKYLILSFENKTDKKLHVSFRRLAYFNGECSNCENEQSKFQLVLQPGETVTGRCDENDKALRVFHSFVTGESDSKLTDFEISEFKATPID